MAVAYPGRKRADCSNLVFFRVTPDSDLLASPEDLADFFSLASRLIESQESAHEAPVWHFLLSANR